MVLIRDIIQGLWQALCGLVMYFVDQTQEAGISPDPLLIALVVVLWTVWLASGCWAASIAGARRHSAKLHFIVGMLFPYVYPVFILFAMDIKGAKKRDREARMQAEADEAERQMAEKAGKMAVAEEEAAGRTPEKRDMDEAYFKEIMLDEDGNPTGPWAIRFGETTVQAQRILEVLPNVVIVAIDNGDGGAQRIRVPYAKITSCTPM